MVIRINKVTIFSLLVMMVFTISGCDREKKGTILSQKDAYIYDTDYTYTVCVEKAGEYPIEFTRTSYDDEVIMYVNGIEKGSLDGKKMKKVYVNKGVNSITLKNGQTVTELVVEDGISNEEVGAYTDYIIYEAENSESNLVNIEESRTYREVASEASGKKCMKLTNEGDYVSFTLEQPADAMIIRYSIPDSEEGNGLVVPITVVVGDKEQKVEVTSKYSWVYGYFPWSNDPATANEGGGHMFFDDVRVVLDKVYPAGTNILLKKEADCNIEFLYVDFIECTERPPVIEMSTNALNILDFGAISDDGEDDAVAIYNCIQKAAEQGMEVYIPKGEFEIGNPIFPNGIVMDKDDITIRGAGMWHTVLKGENAAFAIRAGNLSFYDFSVMGNVTQRRDSLDPPAFDMTRHSRKMRNVQLQNIWMEHWKVGLWSNGVNGVRIAGSRIRNTYADGINLCGGTSNSVVEHNDIRYTGDDGIASWSRGVLSENNKIVHNTVSLPWLANNIALYGGKDVDVRNNLLKDTICFGSGVNLSTKFNPQLPEGTIRIENNKMIRCGSYDYDIKKEYGAIWINTIEGYNNTAQCIIRGNIIEDSAYQGINFYNNGLIDNIHIEDNKINICGTYGIEIAPDANGVAKIINNKITNAQSSEILNHAEDKFIIEE